MTHATGRRATHVHLGLRLMLTLICVVGGAACSEPGGVDETPATIELAPPGPLTLEAGETQQLTVTVRSAGGVALGVEDVSFASGATRVVMVDEAGVAHSVGPVGTASLTAHLAGLTSNAVEVTVVHGPAAYAAADTALPSAPVVGGSHVLAVRVTDAFGNPVPGTAVAFAAAAGGGAVSPDTAATDAEGRAAASATLGAAPGENVFTATVAGADPVSFATTALPGAPASLVKVGGDSATMAAASASPDSLRVRVTDAFGNALAGVAVAFAVAAGDAAVSPPADTTAADGTAAALLTAGDSAGSVEVTATVAGLDPVVFRADVTPVPVAAVAVTPDSSGVVVGALLRMDAAALSAAGDTLAGRTLAWTSSNEAVATVDTAGVLTALDTGLVTITAWTGEVAGTAVVSVEPITQVTQGTGFSCGLTPTGEAYCWGANPEGQLGNGEFGSWDPELTPQRVAGELRFRKLSVGGSAVAALTADGTAYTWGLNRHGALGTGDTISRNLPTAVDTELRFRDISAGVAHMVALTEDGKAYAWGNYYDPASCPGPCAAFGVGDGDSVGRLSPVAVAGDLAFAMVSAGYSSTLGITTDGAAYGWGSNRLGKLGDGTDSTRYVPAPVAGGHAFVTIHTGASHTVALTPGGVAYAWGDNEYGALGDGTRTHRFEPVAVAGGLTFTQIQAGNVATIALTPAGAAYAWGGNTSGQLGNGQSDDTGNVDSFVLTPEPVLGGLTFRTIAAGAVHVIAFAPDGRMWGWGRNFLNELGDGTRTDRLEPVPGGGGLRFK